MSLSDNEILKLEEIYGKKIKSHYERLLTKGRYQTAIRFENEPKRMRIGRNTSSWRLETMLGRKLLTSRLGGNEECDHIDGNPLNDEPVNLQLLTNIENTRKSVIQNFLMGENVNTSKLKECDIIKIRELYHIHDVSLVDISKMYNISSSAASEIVFLNNWKHVKITFDEKYLKTRIPNILLKYDDVLRIKFRLKYGGESCKNLALVYGVSPATISDIKRGSTWKEVSDIFNITILGKSTFVIIDQKIIIDNIEFIFKGYDQNCYNYNTIYIDNLNILVSNIKT